MFFSLLQNLFNANNISAVEIFKGVWYIFVLFTKNVHSAKKNKNL